MKLSYYIKKNKTPLRQATLCFLFRKKEILLAQKKRGFGKGKINGVGGKVNDGEGVEDAAKRETFEEIGVKVKSLNKVAVLDFYHINDNFNQQVFVFEVRDWEREPKESEEMAPFWCPFEKIPYKEMWWDDILWLPRVLKGKKIKASFLFNEKEEILDYLIEEIEKDF